MWDIFWLVVVLVVIFCIIVYVGDVDFNVQGDVIDVFVLVVV